MIKPIFFATVMKTALVLGMLLGLSACQESAVRYDATDTSVSHGPVSVKHRAAICKRHVAMKKRRYGRLNYRKKRRLLYDYVTHIKASINSKLSRPRGLTPGSFCVVRIKQRVDGCVRKISFTRCLSRRMRRSVREAINQASPLPEAPHPDLFDDTVELKFKI